MQTKNSPGFSIVELMIAFTITVIIAASMVPLISFVTKTTHRNQIRIAAQNLAVSQMEKIKAINYEDIGITGGSPDGAIDGIQNISSSGFDFIVKTQVGISSSEDSNTYKNVRVKVMDVLETETYAELNTIITPASAGQTIPNTSMYVVVKDTTGKPLMDYNDIIEITGPTNMAINAISGVAFFEGIMPGTYTVKAYIVNYWLDDIFFAPFETFEDGCLVRENVYVSDYSCPEVDFHMDYKEMDDEIYNYGTLSFKLKCDNEVIKQGKASLSVIIDGEEYQLFNNKPFSEDDFDDFDDYIDESFFGELWPYGRYLIKITDMQGYNDYNMADYFTDVEKLPLPGQTPPYDTTGTYWHGKLYRVYPTKIDISLTRS